MRRTLPLAAVLAALFLACSDDKRGVPVPELEEPAADAATEADPVAGAEAAIADDPHPQQAEFDERRESPLIRRARLPDFADLPGILERGSISVIVTPSRTNFFFAGTHIRGFEYELLGKYEQRLKKKVGHRRFKMLFLPVPFNEVLPGLLSGQGDVAAAGLTITPERAEQVAFSAPYLTGVNEVLVTRPGVELESLDDLAGQTVYVARGSSYVGHLSAAVPGADVTEAPEHLTVEDLLELVRAEVIPFTVADRHVARIWSGVFPELVIRDDLVVHEGGDIAWAVRQNNPELLADLNAFARAHRQGTLIGNVLFKRYFKDARWVSGPSPGEDARLLELEGLFRKYGERYDIDWLTLAALAFQESRFDHNARSRAGAVGMMQVLPKTAASIGIQDPENLESNIHAGAKYLDWMREHYFDDPGVRPGAQIDFALASYNAGPNRVRRLRRKAPELGYDPDVWFGNVEQLMLQEVGWEPVGYVAGINKYYFALSLQYELFQRRERTKQKLLDGG